MRWGMAREMKTYACAIGDLDIKQVGECSWLMDNRPCSFDRLTPRSDLVEAMQYEGGLLC